MKKAPSPVMSARTYHDTISQRARELWHEHGCPEGRDVEIWLEAERDLVKRNLIPGAPPTRSHRNDSDEEDLTERLDDFGVPPVRSATSLDPSSPPS